jgi:uncharacterized membrane protein
MASWKRDFASGLIVIVPVLVTVYVISWIYGFVARVTPASVISPDLLDQIGISTAYAEILRVLVAVVVFVVLVFAVGYLMRTTAGGLFEAVVDDVFNRMPGLRVVYNASKMAAETALGGTESLQEPVKVETWDGLRMTAFKTGKRAPDGREVIFLPTAPNITTGFVVEVDSDRLTKSNETVEDALTRILSAGFGENDRSQTTAMDVLGGNADVAADGDPDEDRDREVPSEESQ